MPTCKITAIVPAAGIGSRMQSSFPKQYLTIAGRTVLEHSINALLIQPAIEKIVLVLHPDDQWFDKLSLAFNPAILRVQGGATRAESVLAGLGVCDLEHWVLVHDAARPCLTQADLKQLIAAIPDSPQGAILACPVIDTLKKSVEQQPYIEQTLDREQLWHALTPQLFPGKLLLECLSKALQQHSNVTDEASALEQFGYQPRLISGSRCNLKVTHPDDLALASFYLERCNLKENK
jgi:2-C-methyl-D-erythritol 4-phosphate cytidylyltransferase